MLLQGLRCSAVLCILHSASHFSIPLRPHPSCRSLARGSLGAEIVFLSYPMSFRLSYCAVILAAQWIHTRIDRIHTSLHNFRIRIKPVFSSRKIAPESRFHVAAIVQSRTWCFPFSIYVLAPKPFGLFVSANHSYP